MASPGSSRRQVPFGGHQLAEYALAAALVVVGLHLGGRPAVILAVAGAVIGAFAFISQGPLAALRIIPRRLHVYLDLVLAAGFAASPLLYLHNLQIIAIVLSEAVAVLLVRMSFTTEIVPRPVPAGGGAQAGMRTARARPADPTRCRQSPRPQAASLGRRWPRSEVPTLPWWLRGVSVGRLVTHGASGAQPERQGPRTRLRRSPASRVHGAWEVPEPAG